MKIEGIAAVVTGAASGLGEATARELARRGAKVSVFDRDAEKGEKVASEIGGIYCEVDVTSDEKVSAAFDKARAAHGQERILVNCAGVANAAKTVGRDKATGEAKGYPIQQFELAIPSAPRLCILKHFHQCGFLVHQRLRPSHHGAHHVGEFDAVAVE